MVQGWGNNNVSYLEEMMVRRGGVVKCTYLVTSRAEIFKMESEISALSPLSFFESETDSFGVALGCSL